MRPKAEVLYISYDGMTDPLGQSQVLPYIEGLSQADYKFTLISCEKADRFKKNRELINSITQRSDIDWYPLPFTTFPPVISKLLDQRRIQKLAYHLHKVRKFQMVHCRSYIAAEIGLKMKKDFDTKFFFDMRGFWVDERVDGKIWNLKNPFFRFAYNHYKKKEASFIQNADHIVSLTEAAVREIGSWSAYIGSKFSVIPCSADFNHFKLAGESNQQEARKALGIGSGPVLSYLGSVGTWYMLDEMLKFFVSLKKKYSQATFLFLTPESNEFIISRAESLGIDKQDLIVKFSSREDLPFYLAASDLSISFIMPSYSKIASSPTKLGELFAMGIPVVTNSGVGDVKQIVNELGAGIVIDDFSDGSLNAAVENVASILESDRRKIREKAFAYYDLGKAVASYLVAYEETLSQ